MQKCSSCSRGFTLVEVLVALFLIILVLGGLEGGAAGTVRTLRDSASESRAVRLVQARAEWVLAGPCVPSSGIDSSGGIAAPWLATTDGHVVRINQTVRYRTAFGLHTDAYETIGACR